MAAVVNKWYNLRIVEIIILYFKTIVSMRHKICFLIFKVVNNEIIKEKVT